MKKVLIRIFKFIVVIFLVALSFLFALYVFYILMPLNRERKINAQIDEIVANDDFSWCKKLPDFDVNWAMMPWSYSKDDYRDKCMHAFYSESR